MLLTQSDGELIQVTDEQVRVSVTAEGCQQVGVGGVNTIAI